MCVLIFFPKVCIFNSNLNLFKRERGRERESRFMCMVFKLLQGTLKGRTRVRAPQAYTHTHTHQDLRFIIDAAYKPEFSLHSIGILCLILIFVTSNSLVKGFY